MINVIMRDIHVASPSPENHHFIVVLDVCVFPALILGYVPVAVCVVCPF